MFHHDAEKVVTAVPAPKPLVDAEVVKPADPDDEAACHSNLPEGVPAAVTSEKEAAVFASRRDPDEAPIVAEVAPVPEGVPAPSNQEALSRFISGLSKAEAGVALEALRALLPARAALEEAQRGIYAAQAVDWNAGDPCGAGSHKVLH